MQSASKASRHFENIEERVKRLQSRPLAITKAGDPEEKRSFAVHTCYATGFLPRQCGCTERVSKPVATKLIEEGRAEWVKRLKKNGSVYTWRQAIVLTGTADPQAIKDHSEVFKLFSEQVELQNAYAVEREAQALERNRKKIRRSIRTLLRRFRRQLTPKENERCFDDQSILDALQTDDNGPFVSSVVNSQPSGPNPSESYYIEQLGNTARVTAALLKAQHHFYNIMLAAEGLTMNAGKHFENAPKGCGLIVTGGYGKDRIEKVEAFREANQDGTRRAIAANFVPGSGDALDGKPIYNAGQESDVFEESDDYEAIQRKRAENDNWKSVSVIKHGESEGFFQIPELETGPPEQLPERKSILPDPFELAESGFTKEAKKEKRLQKLAKNQEVSVEDARQEDALHQLK